MSMTLADAPNSSRAPGATTCIAVATPRNSATARVMPAARVIGAVAPDIGMV